MNIDFYKVSRHHTFIERKFMEYDFSKNIQEKGYFALFTELHRLVGPAIILYGGESNYVYDEWWIHGHCIDDYLIEWREDGLLPVRLEHWTEEHYALYELMIVGLITE